jgi:Spy/CpxP family protein refolding chaperone
MTRWERPLLLFSIALNIGFLSLAATHRAAREMRVPPPSAPDAPMGVEWRAHRRVLLERMLELDPEQKQRLDSGFDRVQPQLRSARSEVADLRMVYRQALVHGDPAATRSAAASLSRAQARVDSLCAEAMLVETANLRPEQRARYVEWVFRRGPGRGFGGRGFGGRHGASMRDAHLPPPPPDAPGAPLPPDVPPDAPPPLDEPPPLDAPPTNPPSP